ncbi:MAG: bifunctional precorrin-2 dehydrogenase/sirohydrochlorin ferrochelatase [Bacteroidales bacterium]
MFLPVSIDITDKQILLIGGGKVALEKITSLKRFTDKIIIVTIEADDVVKEYPYHIIYKAYEKSDLDGSFLVYACTNIKITNQQIKDDCNEKGILVNVVDNPGLCDFISPAIYKQGNMTVAVSSNGKDVRSSIRWRNRIRDLIDNGSAGL